jgi:carbonic anhydrase/acetyltransferase-like protein (isoleucine patch superfamily)
MSNLRPLPLRVEDPRAAADPRAWLAAQPEEVRTVTRLAADGTLFQIPSLHPESFVDPAALLFGGVILGRRCYVGPFAVVRLDEKPSPAPLVIGDETNVQDGAVVHSTSQRIGARVIVAHQAIVHGATVEDDVTIYIQAVADGAGTVLGRGSFLHQGCYVGKGIRLAPGRYVAPGQKVLTQAEADALPEVPEALLHVRAHVLELNAAHVDCHKRAAALIPG